jgi:hypothetical protein
VAGGAPGEPQPAPEQAISDYFRALTELFLQPFEAAVEVSIRRRVPVSKSCMSHDSVDEQVGFGEIIADEGSACGLVATVAPAAG